MWRTIIEKYLKEKYKNKRITAYYKRGVLSMKKKGALELGINTVVILVIAIILVGGGIAFVTVIFSKLNANVENIDSNILPVQPTPSKPLALPGDTISVKNTGIKTILLGVYNTEPNTLKNAYINSTKCTGSASLQVSGLEQDIDSGKIGAYQIKVAPIGASPGQSYICNIGVFSVKYPQTRTPYKQVQVTLQVTS